MGLRHVRRRTSRSSGPSASGASRHSQPSAELQRWTAAFQFELLPP